MNKDKVLCIYHSRDLDGWTSAAIVKDYYPDTTQVGWDYGQEEPVNMYLSFWDKIFLCDISLSPDTMKNLSKDPRVIWIDHHASAIKDSVKHGYETMSGSRDPKYAACELTWRYVYPLRNMPEAVNLLGLYDSFRHMKEAPNKMLRVKLFQYAARSQVNNPTDAQEFLYMGNGRVNDYVTDGRAIYRHLKLEAESVVRGAFDVVIDGQKGMVVNVTRFNPKNFDIEIPDGEFFGSFHYTGTQWVCSLYSDTVDCSVICKKLGGGGHPGASGFQRQTWAELLDVFSNQIGI